MKRERREGKKEKKKNSTFAKPPSNFIVHSFVRSLVHPLHHFKNNSIYISLFKYLKPKPKKRYQIQIDSRWAIAPQLNHCVAHTQKRPTTQTLSFSLFSLTSFSLIFPTSLLSLALSPLFYLSFISSSFSFFLFFSPTSQPLFLPQSCLSPPYRVA
ncbi:hypothetical protein F5X96DRAFT_476330 [Biscogniauxia mediterranea]|nr:hypothetical protein F5X96DRAFT_476330 [Biscogniauxia mediterranea]